MSSRSDKVTVHRQVLHVLMTAGRGRAVGNATALVLEEETYSGVDLVYPSWYQERVAEG